MKYISLFTLIIITCLTPLTSSALILDESKSNKSVLISTYHEDVSGDGVKEKIELKGTPLSQESDYYHNIWINITNKDSVQLKASYGGGYNPTLKFIDINHNSINDILLEKEMSKKLHQYQLQTVKNNEIKVIDLPKHEFITGKFKNDFQVEIRISHNQKPITVDIKDQSSSYIKEGIYDEQGKVKDKKNVDIEPISLFEPVFLNKNKGYGLKSKQQIYGSQQTDHLGTVETLWYNKKNEWIIFHSQWISNTN